MREPDFHRPLSTDPSFKSRHLIRLRFLLCLLPLACSRFRGLLWCVRALNLLTLLAKSDELHPALAKDSDLLAHECNDLEVARSDALHLVVHTRRCLKNVHVNIAIESVPAPLLVRGRLVLVTLVVSARYLLLKLQHNTRAT